jgi:pimeloyl-ACP methyl ester carboxylesterase
MTVKAFLLMVAAGILSGCNIQYRLLYYPSSSPPSEQSLKADQIKPWPSSIADYRGFIAADEGGYPKGTIVVFHGNGGTAADRAFYVKVLGPLGYRVILAEYPRYGGRKGELGEKAFVNDGSETVRLAFAKYGEPLFLLGESLGCGIAAAIARETSLKIDGIVLITPWDTLTSLAQSKFPFLPVRYFMKDKYDNIENLRVFKGRIAVVGAGRDEIVPIVHAKDLYDSLLGTARRMWIIQGAGHNDWPMATSTSWWREIMDFVSSDQM